MPFYWKAISRCCVCRRSSRNTPRRPNNRASVATATNCSSNICKKDLIIVDELGYWPMDTRGAEHLFSFFSKCYEQVSLIVTTNLPFAEWPSIFAGDARLAGAVIDRLTHRVHIVEIAGESY